VTAALQLLALTVLVVTLRRARASLR